jgi:methyl-accepting chemotaxis protein
MNSLVEAIATSTKKIISNFEEYVTQAKDSVKQAFTTDATEAMANILASTNKITESAKSYSKILKCNPAQSHPGQAPSTGLNPRQKANKAIRD